MHLDTVMTMVDRDAFTIYPDVRAGLTAYELRPGAHGTTADRAADAMTSIAAAHRRTQAAAVRDRRRSLRSRARAVGRRQQRARSRPRRGRRLRAKRRDQHRAAARGRRGDHHRRVRARPRPRRPALHELPDHPRRRRERSIVMTTVTDMRGRSFLTLAEFSPEELTYLLDLAAQLKADRRDGREEQRARRKDDRPDLREGLDPDAVRVRSGRVSPGRACDVPRAPPGRTSATRRRSRTRRACSAACTTRSSTAGSGSQSPTSSPAGPACPSTTGSPTSGTRPRSWPTS